MKVVALETPIEYCGVLLKSLILVPTSAGEKVRSPEVVRELAVRVQLTVVLVFNEKRLPAEARTVSLLVFEDTVKIWLEFRCSRCSHFSKTQYDHQKWNYVFED